MLTRLIARSRQKRQEQFRCGNGQYSGSNSDEAIRPAKIIVAAYHAPLARQRPAWPLKKSAQRSDARAAALAPIIAKIQPSGVTTLHGIALALQWRGVAARNRGQLGRNEPSGHFA
jgi:hypothetical protein